MRVVHVRVRPARGRLGGGGSTLSTISTTHYVSIWGSESTKWRAPAQDTAETSRVCCSHGRNPSRRCAGRSRARESRAGGDWEVKPLLVCRLGAKHDQIARTCTGHNQDEPRRAELAARTAEIRAANVRVVHVRVRPARGRLGGGGATLSTTSTTHYVSIWGNKPTKSCAPTRDTAETSRDEPSLLLTRPKSEPPACKSFTCACVPSGGDWEAEELRLVRFQPSITCRFGATSRPNRAHLHETQPRRAETSRVCCSHSRNPSRRRASRSRARASRAGATGGRRSCA